jgi:hypothetical protein
VSEGGREGGRIEGEEKAPHTLEGEKTTKVRMILINSFAVYPSINHGHRVEDNNVII